MSTPNGRTSPEKSVYEAFFNLEHKPFELAPNPSFLYPSAAHRKALNYLTYGIRQQSGFILLTGEVGTGKTTLIRGLIKSQLADVTLSKIFNTKVSSLQLLEMILDDFGVRPSGKDKPTLLRELNDFLIAQFRKGRQSVLIVDEAQNLDHELLEEVRLLSNLENDQQKLLRIILVGQPELKDLLAKPELLQLRQRIQVSCHISPLQTEEIEGYITHRLESAGNREAVTFGPGAFEAVHRYSRGVPRLINILCDYLLLDAFANESRRIEASSIHEVAADLNFDSQYWNPPAQAGLETEPEETRQPATAHRTVNPAAARANNKITQLLKNLNGRLKTIEEALPRLEASLSAPPQDQNAIAGQLTDLQDTLQSKLEDMWQTISLISGEVHSLRERLDTDATVVISPHGAPREESLPGGHSRPGEAAEAAQAAVEAEAGTQSATRSRGWIKRLIFGTLV